MLNKIDSISILLQTVDHKDFSNILIYDQGHQLYVNRSDNIVSTNRLYDVIPNFLLKTTCDTVKLSQKSKYNIQLMPSLNGFVVVNNSTNTVLKCLLKKYEPNFVLNEKTAHSLWPNCTPKLIKYGEAGEHSYVIWELINGKIIKDWATWHKVCPQIYEMLLNNTLVNNCSHSETDYRMSLEKSISSPLKNDYKRIKSKLTHLLSLYPPLTKVNTSFAHGDLTIKNVFFVNTHPILFDWANGGVQNIVYDLTVPLMYFSSDSVWRYFSSKSLPLENHPILGSSIGLTKHSLNASGLNNYDDNVFKKNMLYSLFELLNKNYERHQQQDSLQDGRDILFAIERTLNICLLSFENSRLHP